MQESQQQTRYLTYALGLWWIVLILVASTVLFGCRAEAPNIQADLWLVDPEDASIYRQVEDANGPREEFVYCKDPSAEKFIAMTKDDFKKWTDYYFKNCTCP